jgi:hypothetical protein
MSSPWLRHLSQSVFIILSGAMLLFGSPGVIVGEVMRVGVRVGV